MSVNRINQTELSYSCGAGVGSVNLFTGRMLFTHHDISIGISNYLIEILHIYNSQFKLPTSIDAYKGAGWKLNVEQYLFLENGKYIYIDGAGYRHEFALLNGSKYYDTSGLGLTLNVTSVSMEITDEPGNKMIFENNRMIKTISCQNDTIIKHYEYNNSGKIVSVYDNRTKLNKVVFTYDSDTGLLKTISCKRNNNVIETIAYFYNDEKHLFKITRTVDEITKIDSLFIYNYNKNQLLQATGFEDKSTILFSYTDEKVVHVRTGIADISVSTKKEQEIFIGDDIYCRDDLYLGDTGTIEEYKNNGGASTLGENRSSFNRIEYKTNNTVVTNVIDGTVSKDMKSIYYFNEKGYTTSVFEMDEGSSVFLLSPRKIPGILMMNHGSSQYTINGQISHSLNTSQTISTDNLMSSRLNEIKVYRKDKYPNYINYSCGFFLKLNAPLTNSKIQVTVNSTEVSIGTFDSTAVGSWQYVSIPFKITNSDLQSLQLQFLDSLSKSFDVADMRLCYSPKSSCFLTDGTYVENLEYAIGIIYTTPSQPTINVTKDITKDFYISASDLYLTYLSRFKARGLSQNGSSFVLSCCDGTNKIAVNSVKFVTPSRFFPIEFSSDNYGTSTSAKFYYQNDSPDAVLKTINIFHFIKNKIIGTKTYDCIRQITEVNRYPKDHNDHLESYTESYVSLIGQILKEIDEYGVENVFEYDLYGVLSSKTIQNNETNEKLVFTSSTSPVYSQSTDFKSDVGTNYNDPLGHVDSVWYKGKDESASNRLNTTLTYDRFNSKLMSVENDLNGSNYLNYGGGKLIEVTPIGWKKPDAYGYKFGYNTLGESDKYYLTFKSGNNKVQDLLFKKNISRINSTITTEQYRNTIPDITEVQLDKYGRPISVKEGNSITEFTRQNVSESSASSVVTQMYDPFENRTYDYSYDDFNNLSKYEIKNGSSGSSNFLSIEATGVNKNTYFGFTNTPYEIKLETELHYDQSRLIIPRIEKTEISVDSKSDETNYSYDKLGRLDHKEHKIFDGVFGAYTSITEETTYKPNTLLKQKVFTKIDNPSSPDTEYDFDYGYDLRGNIITSILTQKYNGNTNYSSSSAYSYDKANRLSSEYNDALSDIAITYTYNSDGSINTKSSSGTTRKYEYEKGRLVRFYNTSTPSNKTYFGYDRLGNCTHYMRNPSITANMEWSRGSQLKKYIGSSTVNYFYNSQGVRFKKEITGGKTTNYYYDGLKLLGEESGYLEEIKYLYDVEGIKGFKKRDIYTTYNYVKDAIGNIIAILDEDKEVAHYEYDAWGNCTITKDIDGIGTLNPFRWKSHYYDNESGFYYMGGRYYSPAMKSFISPCNFDEILYNISIPGNLNAYSIGNPMYFPVNSYNIYTSIPLVPENIGSDGESEFWRFLGSVGRFVGGAIITVGGALLTYTSAPLFLVPGLSIIPQFGITMTMYGAFMMASSWDSQIKEDMDRIGWNPFNTNADMSGVNKVSFYKGQTVVLHNTGLSSFSFGIMFLHEEDKNDLDAVKHEWGHFSQLLAMGPLAYTGFVAIPSVLNYQFGDHNNYNGLKSQKLYYSKIWERTADWLGGVNRNNYDPFWSWSNFVPW